MSAITTRATRRASNSVLRPREGYDLAADGFAAWHWTKFWQRHEAPLVRLWLNSIAPGLGLDAGTGFGPYLKDATKAGHRCIAIDVSIRMLATVALRDAALDGRHLVWTVQSDVRKLPVKDGELDWVLTTRVLSNNAEPECILNEFARVTKSGAGCLITDVHPDHPYEQMSITTGDRTLAIETHRHALVKIVSLAAQSFRIVHCVEYRLCDLTRQPSRRLFKKIYDNSSAPIFYLLTLERK